MRARLTHSPLYSADPGQRVGHRRAPRVEPVEWREGGVVLMVWVEMEASGGGETVGEEVMVCDGEGGEWEEREKG